jgi:hypothetical protein
VEIVAATPAVQDGRIYIERINTAFVVLLNNGSKATPSSAPASLMPSTRAGFGCMRAAPI